MVRGDNTEVRRRLHINSLRLLLFLDPKAVPRHLVMDGIFWTRTERGWAMDAPNREAIEIFSNWITQDN